MKKFTKHIVFIGTFIIMIVLNKHIFAAQYKNTTKAYFLSEVTAGYGNGDCILLENYDSNGEVHYGLIDTGREIKTIDENGKASTKVTEFLKKHMKKNELEFLLITHSHVDHNGDAITVINNFNVKTLYMKEYDDFYSNNDGWQKRYEDIIIECVNKNVNIIGCNYNSIISRDINPSTSDTFLEFLKQNSNKKILFNRFNEKNTKFYFGSSYIEIMNWQFFNNDGGIWNYGDEVSNREKVNWENNNSLGVRLTQGKKKAFFAGDINNLDKNTNIGKLGDEERIKDVIGDIDLLKLGHHGYSGSNTEEYLNTLKPEYAVITNNISGAYIDTIEWLKNNNVEYLYNTTDEKSVIATITNDSVNLNFETTNEIKKINQELYYIGKNINEDVDWKNLIYKIEYNESQKIVNTWEELDKVIKSNKINYSVDDKNKKITITKLKILIDNNEKLVANKNIEIDTNQFITILPKNNNEINIIRDISYNKEIFTVKGNLTLGIQNLKSKIIIDGNKEKVLSQAPIIEVDSGTLNIYDNVFIKNNNHTVTENNNIIKSEGTTKSYSASGSGVLLDNESIFNMYGGEISGNVIENKKEIKLENIDLNNYYSTSCDGSGIYITRQSIFNMYGGRITNNSLYNNSIIILNNVKDKAFSKATYQNATGSGICCYYSKINIEAGEISNNYSENNSVLKIIDSQINNTDNSIYGVGIYSKESIIDIKNAKLKDNKGINNSNITIQGSSINNNLNSTVDGGAIRTYYSKSFIEKNNIRANKIEVNSKINLWNSYIKRVTTTPHGASIVALSKETSIYNTTMKENECYNDCDITLEEKSKVDEIFCSSRGGTIYGNNSVLNLYSDELSYGIAKSNLKINKSEDSSITQKNDLGNSYGGAIDTYNSALNINDSKLENNLASFGGAIYTGSSKCITKIANTEICNNTATDGSGGGIYAFGKIFINGTNNKINNNTAKTYGGGLIIKNIAVIEDSEIIENNAELYAGGGIRVDGRLIITSGWIKGNKSNTTGGGIDYTNGLLIKTNVDISDNLSNTSGTENLYPQISKITKDEIPPEIKISYNKDEEQELVEVTITVKDLLSEVKQVTINGKSLEISDDGTIKLNIDRNGIFIVKAKDYIGNIATKEFSISNLVDKNVKKEENETKANEDLQDNNNIQVLKENVVQNTHQIINDRNNEEETAETIIPESNNEQSISNQTKSENEIVTDTEDNSIDEGEVNTNSKLKEETGSQNSNINDSNSNVEEINSETQEELLESDYIDDEQMYKEVQDALASNMPKTGQKSLTFIFSVLGIIAFENYIKLRKYREII